MSRKSVLLGLAILVLLAGTVTASLVFLVRREPEMYDRVALPPGQERQKHSEEFYKSCFNLASTMINNVEWEEQFTEAQINSYFDEDFIRSGVKERLLPEGISQPRVALEPDRITIAFRYGDESWLNTVISIDLRVWLVPAEPNTVALEIQGLHAGSLPISAQSLLDRVSEVARRQDIEVSWYRHSGNPVALLRFQAAQPRPTVRLERLVLQKGMLVIGGRSVESAPLRAMLAPPGSSISLEPSAN
jgi:hypothetical protein